MRRSALPSPGNPANAAILALGDRMAVIAHPALGNVAKKKKGDPPAAIGRRGEPYTTSDALTLYTGSAPFRRMANEVGALLRRQLWSGDSDETEQGRSTAIDAAKLSTEAAKALGAGTEDQQDPTRLYYLHPGAILYWIRQIAKAGGGDGYASASGDLPSPDILAALIRAGSSSRVGFDRAWLSFMNKLPRNADDVPYWFAGTVFAHQPPADLSAARAFPLRTITVGVPMGAIRKVDPTTKRAYFVPRTVRVYEIDLRSDLARQMLGDIQIAVSPDGKRMFFASNVGRRVTCDDFAALINTGKLDREVPGSLPLGQADTRAIAPKIPNGLAQQLQKAEQATPPRDVATVPLDSLLAGGRSLAPITS